jgi:hypothetical protein
VHRYPNIGKQPKRISQVQQKKILIRSVPVVLAGLLECEGTPCSGSETMQVPASLVSLLCAWLEDSTTKLFRLTSAI